MAHIPDQTTFSNGTKTRVAATTAMLSQGIPSGFELSDDGVHLHISNDNPRYRHICGPISVTAISIAPNGMMRSKLITFKDVDGHAHEQVFSLADFAHGASKVIQSLRAVGLRVLHGADDDLARLLDDWLPTRRITELDHHGWVGDNTNAYLTTDGRCVGLEDHLLCGSMTEAQPARGTLDTWRAEVARPCGRDPVLMLALCSSFVGPLLRILDLPMGGINFVGTSPDQDDLLSTLVRSVGLGDDRLVGNLAGKALIQACDRSRHGTLALGRVGAADLSRVANRIAAQIQADHAPVSDRVSRNSFAIVSSSAQPINDMPGRSAAVMAMKTCLIDLKTEESTLPDDAVSQILRSAQHNHGLAGPAFVAWLLERVKLPEKLSKIQRWYQERQSDMRANASRSGDASERMVGWFAATSLAGELATKAGLTGWQSGDAYRACEMLLKASAEALHSSPRSDAEAYLGQILRYVADHAGGFAVNAGSGGSAERAGYRDEHHIFVLPATWRTIFREGARAAARTLKSEGLLRCYPDGYQYRLPRSLDPAQPKVYALRAPAEVPK